MLILVMMIVIKMKEMGKSPIFFEHENKIRFYHKKFIFNIIKIYNIKFTNINYVFYLFYIIAKNNKKNIFKTFIY